MKILLECDVYGVAKIDFFGKSVWQKRLSGNWAKETDKLVTPARAHAEMVRAIRYFSLDPRAYRLSIDATTGTLYIKATGERPGQMRMKVQYMYRCAGCGKNVIRNRPAKPGHAVWCGGNRCKTVRMVRETTIGGDLARALRSMLIAQTIAGSRAASTRTLPGNDAPPTDRIVIEEMSERDLCDTCTAAVGEPCPKEHGDA